MRGVCAKKGGQVGGLGAAQPLYNSAYLFMELEWDIFSPK